MLIIRGRENYYKYQDVKTQLEEELQVEQSARTIAKKLNIAISTFHKYKNLLQLEKGQQFMTSDERVFKERLRSSIAHVAPALKGKKK
jgi:DNA-directed RNA polymerase specialized sigma subunit